MDIEKCRRVHDTTYSLKIHGHTERIFLDISDLDISTSKAAIKALFTNMTEDQYASLLNSSPKTLKIGDKNFILKRNDAATPASKLTNFVQTGKFKNIVKLQLGANTSLRTSSDLGVINIQPPTRSSVRQKDDRTVIRSLKLPDLESLMSEGLFADPFSRLATRAFQNYHLDFAQNVKDKSRYAIGMKLPEDGARFGIDYILIDQSDKENIDSLPNVNTIANYYQMLVKTWGKEKIDTLQLRYGINFVEMMNNNAPLSVDIVYQMNIGLSLRDAKDVNFELTQLKKIYHALASDTPREKNLLKALDAVDVPTATVKGLATYLKGQNIQDVPSAKLWLETSALLQAENSNTLGVDDFALLMEIFSLTPTEQEKAYTGRQIGEFIDSAYTIASKENFKPWVDDQEFTETNTRLLDNSSWDYFAQQLTYIICKKHLLRRDLQNEYTVGALIAAPRADGAQEWFQVTSCINSGTGNLSYTLEPAAANSDLPFIKLFRSTASNAYAFDGKASFNSDVNPLNSPGYEGQILVEEFEEPAFFERTIPLWVGYLEQAKSIIQNEKQDEIIGAHQAATLLKRANEAFIDQSMAKEPQSLKSLLRHYDWVVLNSLKMSFNNDQLAGNASLVDALQLTALVKKYALKTNDQPIGRKEQQKDAQFLLRMLASSTDPYTLEFCRHLNNLLTAPSTPPLNSEEQIEIDQLIDKQAQYNSAAVSDENVNRIKDTISTWMDALQSLAESKNEAVEQKVHQKIVCMGHSLGGAHSQRTFAKYTLLRNRIPVPGQKIEEYDFGAPGINKEDNQSFVATGNRHADLLFNMDKPFVIHRRQIAGDFVILGGDVHLGATYEHGETHRALRWLVFDAEVMDPLPTATHPGITDAFFTHGIQAISPKYNGTTEKTAKEYISIPFDTGVQGEFRKGNSSLRKQIWRIDKFLGSLIDFENNSALLRTALRTDLFIQTHSKEVQDPLHGHWYEHASPEGVFAVDTTGIKKSKHRKSDNQMR